VVWYSATVDAPLRGLREVTLPAFKALVQTSGAFGVPLGSVGGAPLDVRVRNRRLGGGCECETLIPKPGPIAADVAGRDTGGGDSQKKRWVM